MLKKNYKFKEKSYKYWVSRMSNKERQVCTSDFQLDLLEEDQIIKRIKDKKTILEIGSGNGILLKRLLKSKKIKEYIGTDLVAELTNISQKKFKNFKNLSFFQKDMTLINKTSFNNKFDYIISKRAIQNVLNSKLQLETIDNVGHHLKKNGLMILVESSASAQKNINFLREKYNLPRIQPPFHNLFFNDSKIMKYKFKNLKLIEIDNFSSNFYFITRIIYAFYAKNYTKEKIKYSHGLNKIALMINDNLLNLDLSQVKTYLFRKK